MTMLSRLALFLPGAAGGMDMPQNFKYGGLRPAVDGAWNHGMGTCCELTSGFPPECRIKSFAIFEAGYFNLHKVSVFTAGAFCRVHLSCVNGGLKFLTHAVLQPMKSRPAFFVDTPMGKEIKGTAFGLNPGINSQSPVRQPEAEQPDFTLPETVIGAKNMPARTTTMGSGRRTVDEAEIPLASGAGTPPKDGGRAKVWTVYYGHVAGTLLSFDTLGLRRLRKSTLLTMSSGRERREGGNTYYFGGARRNNP
ncbi:hypothetical protein B0H14DRAFT_2567607 [Mycena olivaceomarginata]|nr:hypothetical protein B0H14DRAFT_2567607 [Mycena olivaceomarginata]